MKLITRASLGAALALSTLAVAGPAHAGNEVSKKACAEAGGIYDNVKGTKSCTLTATSSATGAPFTAGFGAERIAVYLTYERTTVTTTTTTQTQRGGGPTTSTVNTTMSSSDKPLTCVIVQSRSTFGQGFGFQQTVRQAPVEDCGEDILARLVPMDTWPPPWSSGI